MKMHRSIKALADSIKRIWNALPPEARRLQYSGPRGGSNARYIPGWVHVGDGTLTKACRRAGVPTMPYWSGAAPTPAQAIPKVFWEAIQADRQAASLMQPPLRDMYYQRACRESGRYRLRSGWAVYTYDENLGATMTSYNIPYSAARQALADWRQRRAAELRAQAETQEEG